jgi:hypothetical protein
VSVRVGERERANERTNETINNINQMLMLSDNAMRLLMLDADAAA